MEQEKNTNSVQQTEQMLGIRVFELRKRLKDYESTKALIESDCAAEKTRAEQQYQKDTANTKNQYMSDLNGVQSSYRSRVESLESAHKHKANERLDDSAARLQRVTSMAQKATTLQNEWSKFIDTIYEEIDDSIDSHKKSRTESIRKEWEDLNRRKNQQALGQKGHAEYDRVSPFLYALQHPFAVVPEWFFGFRIIGVIASIVWIIFLVGRCMWDAYWDHDASSFMGSSAVLYFLFIILGCMLLGFVICFISAMVMVHKANVSKKKVSEETNDYILWDKSKAEKGLIEFEYKYKSVYYHDGRWDWDWHRYPMSKTEADDIMTEIWMMAELRRPELLPEMKGYEFKLNYNAL